MCDIINLTDADIKQLKKNNNTDFYDCVWGMTPISTEYLRQVAPNRERLLNIKRDILTIENEKKHKFINFFFDDLLGRM
jgi:hypothetical protein